MKEKINVAKSADADDYRMIYIIINCMNKISESTRVNEEIGEAELQGNYINPIMYPIMFHNPQANMHFRWYCTAPTNDADQYLSNIDLQIEGLRDAINRTQAPGHIVILTKRLQSLMRLQSHAVCELRDVVSPAVSVVSDAIKQISLSADVPSALPVATAIVLRESYMDVDARNDNDASDDDETVTNYEVESEVDDVDPNGFNEYSHTLDE